MGFHFGKSTSVFIKTLPFVLLRLAVGFAFGVLAVAYFGAISWVLLTLRDSGSISGAVVLVGLVAAGVLFAWVLKLLKKYLLYMVSAGHIAVIAHIVDTGDVPSNQLSHGKNKVTDRFEEASVLFGVDKLVKGAIKQFNKAMVSLQGIVDFVPALENILEVLKRAVAMAASNIDEAILAHMFLNEDQNKWRAARDGVVLYGKTWKSVLGSTIAIVVAMQVGTFLLFLGLTPLASVFGSLTPAFEVLGWVFVLGIVTVAYFGVIKPWVMTVVITTFLVEAQDETPDNETMGYVADRSDKFKELMSKSDAEESDLSPSGESEIGGKAGGEGTPS